MTATEQTEAIEIFFSYAHKDEALLNELKKHLSPLQVQGFIKGWHDRDINAGTEWSNEIDEHLNKADLILLLISPDFMASHYCYSIEMQRAMERHNAGETHVIPIILRPVIWEGAPFDKLQVLPTDGKPVTTWSNHDVAFLQIAQGIRKAVEELILKRPISQSSPGKSKETARTKSTIWNIPFRRNPFFTGRDNVLTDLHKVLTGDKTAVITQAKAISGLGGIGKTQTAIEYAYRYRDEYQLVFWVKSETRDELIADFVTIAGLLKLPEQNAQDQRSIALAVKRWLEEHAGWLLTFDNADDLSMVYEYLPEGNKGHILLTTRAQVMSRLAQKIEIEKMAAEEGALFLLKRAGIIAEHDTLDKVMTNDRRKAIEIVQEVDGLPLALDQAGAYIEETQCSLSSYLIIYRTQHAKLLKQRGGFVPEHPEPVATTWSLSFEKVEKANPAGAELLRLCAFLSPDAIPEEIFTKGTSDLGPILQSTTADIFELNTAIGELLKYSLVRRDPNTQTLTIHRLVQAVLKDGMDEDTQRLWTERMVKAMNRAFPNVDFEAWPLCQRLFPHALICAEAIKQWNIEFLEGARLLNRAAFYAEERAQNTQAEAIYLQALTIREKILGPEHPEVAVTLHDLARLYRTENKYEKAEPLYQRALAICKKVLGPEHPEVGAIINSLAKLYRLQNKYAQAEQFGLEALAIHEKTLAPDHINMATVLNNLAILYRIQGKYTQAEQLYLRALAIRERNLGPDHPNIAAILNDLAVLYGSQSKYSQAEPLFLRALETYEKTLGYQHPYVATLLKNYIILLRATGREAEAARLDARVKAIRAKHAQENSQLLAESE